MKKYTTSHGTYYLVDEENFRAMRVKGDGRNDLDKDGEWFSYTDMVAFDWLAFKSLDESPKVGMSILFLLGHLDINHDYRITTDVTSIEDIEDEAR